VDALAYIGLGLAHQLTASHNPTASPSRAGTFRAMFDQIKRQEAANRREKQATGW